MWKRFLYSLACLFVGVGVAYAAVGVKQDGADKGAATDINFIGATVSGTSQKDVDITAITDDVAITGDLAVSATATVGTTLGVTGATTLSSTLGVTGITTFNAAFGGGYELVTTSAADPGVGAASISDLVTGVVTDATGSAADELSLADGVVSGQLKVIRLITDGETTGLAIIPANFGGGTQILLEDADDVVVLYWDGTNWEIILNTGGTVS